MIILTSTDNEEVELSFARSEGRAIAKRIRMLREHEEMRVESISNPYLGSFDHVLLGLVISDGPGKIKAQLHDSWVAITMNAFNAHILAPYFEFDEDSRLGDYFHFDPFGNENWIDADTKRLVFALGDNRGVG